MGLRIYNSLTNKIEDFKPLNDNKVNMYVCGPTVYNYIHIGNARPVIFFDTFKRYLQFLGYEVCYASNITDVDDKIINKAIEEGTTEEEIATRFANAYFKNCADLGAMMPDVIPYATKYIDQMIDFIKNLIDTGYAYESNGNVYFRVSKIKDYGVLSNQIAEELNAGARIDVVDVKEDPRDFVLWKNTDKGIKWDSPFGAGRPGWHTECVVMNQDIFHQELDVHGGGMDLKFPHHENEIAQSEASYGHHLSKFWMHVGRLDLDGIKMSKSLGNVIKVNDIKEHDDLMSLRLLIISAPYRQMINFNDALYVQFKGEYTKITRAFKQASVMLDLADFKSDKLSDEDIAVFKQEMDDDFNTPNVLTLVQKLVKDINQAIRSKDLDMVAVKTNTLKVIMGIFGIELAYTNMSSDDKSLYNKWNQLKAEKNFEEADKLRGLLAERGLI